MCTLIISEVGFARKSYCYVITLLWRNRECDIWYNSRKPFVVISLNHSIGLIIQPL